MSIVFKKVGSRRISLLEAEKVWGLAPGIFGHWLLKSFD